MSERIRKKQKRRWLSRRELRAVSIGADELQSLLEWASRRDPCALREIRRPYRSFCNVLYRELERQGS
jgi:hypothetical protein